MDLAHQRGGLWKSLCGRALENMDVAHHRGGLRKSFIVVPVFVLAAVSEAFDQELSKESSK